MKYLFNKNLLVTNRTKISDLIHDWITLLDYTVWLGTFCLHTSWPINRSNFSKKWLQWKILKNHDKLQISFSKSMWGPEPASNFVSLRLKLKINISSIRSYISKLWANNYIYKNNKHLNVLIILINLYGSYLDEGMPIVPIVQHPIQDNKFLENIPLWEVGRRRPHFFMRVVWGH